MSGRGAGGRENGGGLKPTGGGVRQSVRGKRQGIRRRRASGRRGGHPRRWGGGSAVSCGRAESAPPGLAPGSFRGRPSQHKEHKGVDAKNAKAWRGGKPLRSLRGYPLRSLCEKSWCAVVRAGSGRGSGRAARAPAGGIPGDFPGGRARLESRTSGEGKRRCGRRPRRILSLVTVHLSLRARRARRGALRWRGSSRGCGCGGVRCRSGSTCGGGGRWG
jgi:hypothetical protein